MQFTEAQISQWLAGFLWPLLRIGAALMAAPIYSVRQIPIRFRMLLAVMITLVVQPVLPAVPVVSNPFPVIGGRVKVPADCAPGLGVEVDPAVIGEPLAEYAL